MAQRGSAFKLIPIPASERISKGADDMEVETSHFPSAEPPRLAFALAPLWLGGLKGDQVSHDPQAPVAQQSLPGKHICRRVAPGQLSGQAEMTGIGIGSTACSSCPDRHQEERPAP